MEDGRLFQGTILDDYTSWHGFLKTPEVFAPLIKHIHEINNLSFDEMSFMKMTIGAVFRTGDKVTKIFFPPEVKKRVSDRREYVAELTVMEHARNAGILVPDVICNGTVRDGPYTFNYIVMNYIEGTLAKDMIPEYNDSEKVEFAFKLKEIAAKLHSPNSGLMIPRFNEPDRINNVFWNDMPESFKEDRLGHIADAIFPEPVVCHGDMGMQNIIVDAEGRLHLIDFAESILAPHYYDLPLLYSDSILMGAYYGDYQNEVFYDVITMSQLLSRWVNIRRLAEESGFDFIGIKVNQH